MKLTLLSPTFPPDHCGVGDHSARLMNALEALGHQVIVQKSWNDLEKASVSTDAVLVQYTPYLWSQSRVRLNPRMSFQFARARRRLGVPVILLAHEVHYPVGWSVRGLLLGWGQKFQFLALASKAHQIYFTYESARKAICEARPLLQQKASVLPVGSNIPVISAPVIIEGGLDHEKILLIHFGGNHPTHCLPWTVTALAAAQASLPEKDIDLIWVGVDEAEKNRILSEMQQTKISSSIRALGYLPANEVSQWLTRSTLVLAPFLDGISTRRGSVMAAFEHSRPVVTNLGWASDPKINWDSFSFASNASSNQKPEDAFASAVCSALNSPDERQKIAAAGLDNYERQFSWRKIADLLVSGLGSSHG